MIYEIAYIAKIEITQEQSSQAKEIILNSISDAKGEVLVNDDWGRKTFAWPINGNQQQGRYFYVMYQVEDGKINEEIKRKLLLNEQVLRHIIIKLGPDRKKQHFVNHYRFPKKEEEENQKKNSSGCYFSENKTWPDWKDPSSYSWLVNDFGKISPARFTGIRPRYQRMATKAIKRARNMGVISILSNEVLS